MVRVFQSSAFFFGNPTHTPTPRPLLPGEGWLTLARGARSGPYLVQDGEPAETSIVFQQARIAQSSLFPTKESRNYFPDPQDRKCLTPSPNHQNSIPEENPGMLTPFPLLVILWRMRLGWSPQPLFPLPFSVCRLQAAASQSWGVTGSQVRTLLGFPGSKTIA